MNLKEAIIAKLQGNEVQTRMVGANSWVPLLANFQYIDLNNIESYGEAWQFRIKPKTIMVHGVEVPAPVTDPLQDWQEYYVPDPARPDMFFIAAWSEEPHLDAWRLEKGLIYLNKEYAQERAKAML